jgi:peptidoglycan hydrolase-like protein with peptidoglycan-binding domain
MKTYKVTSPLMRGDAVKKLQRRLAGANVFKENYNPGKVDGIFGQGTAAAAHRAKHWMGYPPNKMHRTYGQMLDNFLSGKTKLPQDYANRRQQRKKAAAQVPLRQKALNEAKKHLGTKESPAGSNRVQFSVWYGIIGPWCAMFTTYCYVQAGSKAHIRGSKYAYVPYIVQDARRGANGLAVTNSPQPGDLVCFDWNKDGISDHVGLFEKWTNQASGQFSTIEGNTSVSNNSNGGQVMRRDRNRSLVQAFVRVGK